MESFYGSHDNSNIMNLGKECECYFFCIKFFDIEKSQKSFTDKCHLVSGVIEKGQLKKSIGKMLEGVFR